MKAITFQGVESLAYEDVADPRILDADDAIVKVGAAGLCGSDLHPYFGREHGLSQGTVMGHECAGEVVEIGRDVSSFKVGERVVAPFSTSCGSCDMCVLGCTARCRKGELFGWMENGRGLHGCQAEYVRVPLASTTLVALPDELDFASAVLASDNLPTALWATSGSLTKRPTRRAAVLGCGPVGLLAIRSLVSRNVHVAIAVDPDPYRARMAVDFGAATGVDPDAAGRLVDDVGAAGAIIDTAGTAASARLAAVLIDRCGVLTGVGVNTEADFALAPTLMYDLNLTYRTGRCSARSYIRQALAMLQEDDKTSEVISHRLPLSEAPEAYRAFGERKRGWLKVILVP